VQLALVLSQAAVSLSPFAAQRASCNLQSSPLSLSPLAAHTFELVLPAQRAAGCTLKELLKVDLVSRLDFF
jgi:hypothetical protein